MSFALRHDPAAVGLAIDREGWAEVDALLRVLAARDEPVSREELEAIVRASDKQRFAFSEDSTRIRANQGHSIDVDLGLVPSDPPPRLFHGTVDRFIAGIRENGLVRGARQHVHLSVDANTARAVAGRRRGESILLVVRAGDMASDGHLFYRSANGVWLTLHVPAAYIDYPEG